MLVLTRKQNEKIRIGDSITITVLRMKGKAVRLGIEAPHDISVIRGELCFDLEDDQVASQAAAETQPEPAEVPPKSKPLAVGSRRDISSEATAQWPLADLTGKSADFKSMASNC